MAKFVRQQAVSHGGSAGARYELRHRHSVSLAQAASDYAVNVCSLISVAID